MSETSLIVHWLTREHGRVATVVKGALRPKSPFRGKIDFLNQCTVAFQRSRRGELHTLRELVFVRGWKGLRSDLAVLRRASCSVRWIELHTESDTPTPGLFELLVSTLEAFEEAGCGADALLAFEVQFSAMLGLAPDPVQTRLSPKARELLESFLRARWIVTGGVATTPAVSKEFRMFWNGFVTHHLGRLPAHRAEALAG